VRFEKLVETSVAVAGTSGRKDKVAHLARLLVELAPDERAIAARYLSGIVPQKLGIGYAIVGELRNSVPAAAEASLDILEVDRRFGELAALSGTGSNRGRKDGLAALLARATAAEQSFLGTLVLGELRQGALDAFVVEALAKATDVKAGVVRAAYMLAGDIGVVAASVLGDGAAGLARFSLSLFRPVLPMLAQTAEDPTAALAAFGGEASLELKLDGFRVQIHKQDDQIRIRRSCPRSSTPCARCRRVS
jgi:DNA ligase-1